MFKTIDLERRLAEKEERLISLIDSICITKNNKQGMELAERFYKQKLDNLKWLDNVLDEELAYAGTLYPYKSIKNETKGGLIRNE
jgi:hypothetical protein